MTNNEYKGKTYNDFSAEKLAEVQKMLGKKEFLSITETGLWLGLNRHCIYKMIKKGVIVAFKLYEGASQYMVDVEKTRQNFSKLAVK